MGRTISAIALMFMFILPILFLPVSGAYPFPKDEDRNNGGTGSTSLAGNWYVDGGLSRQYGNQTIHLAGDLQVNSTAVLTLRNVTLDITGDILVRGGGTLVLDHSTVSINCASDREHGLTVDRDALLTSSNSTFTNRANTHNYTFNVNGNTSLVDCDLSHMAKEVSMLTPASGLRLGTSAGSYPNFASLLRCVFHDNLNAGVSIRGGRVNTFIRACEFHSEPEGVDGVPGAGQTGLVIRGNNFHNLSSSAITFNSAVMPTPTQNDVEMISNSFVKCSDAILPNIPLNNITISGNLLKDNSGVGVHLKKCTLLTFSHNRFTGNREGLNTSTDLVMDNCTFASNTLRDISVMVQKAPVALNTYYNASKCYYSPTSYILNLWYMNITVMYNSTPMASAGITVNDSKGATEVTGTTNASGELHWCIVTEGKMSFNPDMNTPHNITCTAPGFYPGYLNVEVHGPVDVLISPVGNGVPSPPSNIAPATTHGLTPRISWSPSVDPEGGIVTYIFSLLDGTIPLVDNATLTDTYYDIITPLRYHTSYLARVSARDALGAIGSAQGWINVVNMPPDAPQISFGASTHLTGEDITVSITVLSKDDDRLPTDDILYSYEILRGEEEYMVLDNSTNLSVVIPASDTSPGDVFTATVRAWDGYDSSPVANAVTTIVNGPPSVAAAPEAVSMDEDTIRFVPLDGIFIDPDGGTLLLNVTSSPHIYALVLDNDTLRIAPLGNWHGSELLELTATDMQDSVSVNMSVTVRSVNDPPENNGFSFKFWKSNPCNVTFTAENGLDVDGDALFYQWDTGDGTVGGGKVFVHTFPSLNITWDYTVSLTISDGIAHSRSVSRNVTVDAVVSTAPGNGSDGGSGGNGTNTTGGGDNTTIPNGTDGGTDGSITPPDRPGDNGSNTMAIVAIVVIVAMVVVAVVVVAVVLFMVMKGRGKKEEPVPEKKENDDYLSNIAYSSPVVKEPPHRSVRRPKAEAPPPAEEDEPAAPDELQPDSEPVEEMEEAVAVPGEVGIPSGDEEDVDIDDIDVVLPGENDEGPSSVEDELEELVEIPELDLLDEDLV